jgi:HUS1 checkpoint protein
MEVATALFCHAIKAAQSSTRLTLKLAKKDQRGVLLFDIEATVCIVIISDRDSPPEFCITQSHQRKRVKVMHEVQVTVMHAKDVEKIVEPQCPDPDVSVS